MKTFITIVIAVIAGSVVNSILRAQFTGNDAFAANEKVLADYHARPEATLNRISSLIPVCSQNPAPRPSAAREIDRMVARLVIELFTLRMENVDKQKARKRAIAIIQDHLRPLAARLNEKEAAAALAYVNSLISDKFASCLVQRSIE
ncbi:hypothetical protein ACSV9I_10570 [Rhizobium sp. G187]|uniref:hypothetical protein n=1 Tax=Rhizobium sp. G187 TaxID=3451352 RepID=UPI003EE4E2BA